MIVSIVERSTHASETYLGVNQAVAVQARRIHDSGLEVSALNGHIQFQSTAVRLEVLHDAIDLDPLAVLAGRKHVAEAYVVRSWQGRLTQPPVSRLSDLRSKIEFLRDAFNLKEIAGLERKVFVAFVDIDAGSGILRKEVPDSEIDIRDDGPQADRVATVGLLGGKLADLCGGGQGRQLGRFLAPT